MTYTYMHALQNRTTETRLRGPMALLVLLAAAALLSPWAIAQTSETPALPIEIFGDNGQLDVPSGAYVLTGNVRIVRGTLNVFADEARSFSGDSGEIERVELYGTPTRWNDTLEDGSDVQGQSDQILYDFTTNLITMKGNAEIQNVQGQFSGNQLVYDLDTQNLVGDGGVRLLIEPATAEAATQQLGGQTNPGQTGTATEETAGEDAAAAPVLDESGVDEPSVDDPANDEPASDNG